MLAAPSEAKWNLRVHNWKFCELWFRLVVYVILSYFVSYFLKVLFHGHTTSEQSTHKVRFCRKVVHVLLAGMIISKHVYKTTTHFLLTLMIYFCGFVPANMFRWGHVCWLGPRLTTITTVMMSPQCFYYYWMYFCRFVLAHTHQWGHRLITL